MTAPALSHEQVHVWRVLLTGDAEQYAAHLSPAERARLDRRLDEQRAAFAISHGAMRAVIGNYLGCPPAAVPLEAPYGRRPTVAGLEVSLAHAGDLALVAVATRPVGVDVELIEHADDPDLDAVAHATLTRLELERFRKLSQQDRPRAWLRSWVRKEAVLKARGEGLSDQLVRQIDVASDHHGDLRILDVEAGSGYIAAVAVARSQPSVKVLEWAC